MRIALNAHLLSFAATYRGAGISRSIANLLRGLQTVDAENEYTVFLGTRQVPAGFFAAPNFHPALSPLPTAWPPARILWEQAVQPVELARRRSQLLHALAYVLPLAWSGPSVVTVYDLSFWRTPERFPAAQRLYLRTLTRLSMRRAARVIAISQSTKRDLVELLGVPAERVRVVPLAIEDEFRPVTDTAVLADLRRRRGLPEHMILYVGTLEPRKNLVTLLEAYARWGAASPETPWPPLVLAGGKGWGYEAIFATVERLGLGQAVLFPGFVPHGELPLWYSAADVFVYPSLYEGFGLPVLEALACGTPVITSNVSSLPEVAGEAGLLVDPTDADALAEALRRVWGDADLRQAMRTRGLAQAARFSLTALGRQTRNVYQEAVDAN
ncbi:MAG: glycosyltransferase family 4 protein [Chloroflexi bacterium]|nr:glycosyltransferase family 4 protein [Chloroflexota bacterium]